MQTLFILTFLMLSCTQVNQDPVVRIVLYQDSKVLTNEEAKIFDFSASPKKVIDDGVVLLGFQNKSPMKHTGPIIWKGYKWVDVIYGSGKTERLKLSNYGSFLRSLNDDKLYEISDTAARNKWQVLVASTSQYP